MERSEWKIYHYCAMDDWTVAPSPYRFKLGEYPVREEGCMSCRTQPPDIIKLAQKLEINVESVYNV